MKEKFPVGLIKSITRYPGSWLMLLVPLAYIIIFAYVPMYGIQLAFREVNPIGGITKGKFIGLENFRLFVSSFMFGRLLKNTILLSIYQLAAGFPLPIILAFCINEIRNIHARKIIQTITYAPYFISVIVLVSIMQMVFSPHTGIINNLVGFFGGEPVNFMGRPDSFRHFYVWSGVWQNMGYNAVIYIAALTGIDPALHEAAMADGASRWKRIIHVDLPGIIPTIVVLLILNCGRIMNLGFEKAYLMQNSMNSVVSEIIPTYVYKIGLLNNNYGFATAVGLFNSIINLVLIVGVNTLSKKYNQTSLW
ncbi:MAG: ABC transporter permease subunit [Treponema sp.]|nr:ABC transporter permease subunit [Treponema sp.]